MGIAPDLRRRALREEARLRGDRSYDPGTPCKEGHQLRSVSSDNCLECCKKSTNSYVKRNPDKAKEWAKITAKRHPESSKRARKRWKEKNPVNVKARIREYCRLRKLNNERAIPSWADRKAIREIYKDAVRLTLETGIPHTVDHIVPLKGVDVCGLHVESNLQILTKEENDWKWRYNFG